MNTDYKTNPFAAFGGTGSAGVDLSQLFIAPTIAWKTGNQSLGASLNLAYQRFKAEGIQGFAGFSSSPGSVSNQGYDDSTGYGVRVGWTGRVSSTVTLGATYQTKTKMSKFDKYKGLFANGGEFDIPENYGIGIAVQAIAEADPGRRYPADQLQRCGGSRQHGGLPVHGRLPVGRRQRPRVRLAATRPCTRSASRTR